MGGQASSNQPHTQKWLPGGLQFFLLPRVQSRGLPWSGSSHQQAIVNGTEGLCAHVTLRSLMRLLPAEDWLLENCKRPQSYGVGVVGVGAASSLAGRAEAAWNTGQAQKSAGWRAGYSCRYLAARPEKVSGRAGDPGTASDTHWTPTSQEDSFPHRAVMLDLASSLWKNRKRNPHGKWRLSLPVEEQCFQKGWEGFMFCGLGISEVIQPGLDINVSLLNRPFLHLALDINSVSWISAGWCLRFQRQCLTRFLENVMNPKFLCQPSVILTC